jgi:hypothetical protein
MKDVHFFKMHYRILFKDLYYMAVVSFRLTFLAFTMFLLLTV